MAIATTKNLYSVIDLQEEKIVAQILTAKEVSDLIGVYEGAVNTYAKNGSRCKKRYKIVIVGTIPKYRDSSQEQREQALGNIT